MKSTATGIVAILPLFMAAAPANAADTGDPMIEEQIAKEQARWSGAYAGIAGTIGMTTMELSADGGSLDGLGSEGAGLTGIVGYDQRFGRFVIGGFADFTYSDDFWQSEASFGSGSAEVNREYDWTAGIRVGKLINPNTMAYLLAGYSQMKMGAVEFSDGGSLGKSITYDGYTVGAGLESKVNEYLSWYAEGRWSQYDGETAYGEDGDGFTIEAEPSEVKAMMGLKLRLLTE